MFVSLSVIEVPFDVSFLLLKFVGSISSRNEGDKLKEHFFRVCL